MIIWQKSLEDGRMIAIGKNHSELAEIFLDEDVIYNIQIFDKQFQIENESGWYLVGENHLKLTGCLHWLYDHKYINSHEYNILEESCS